MTALERKTVNSVGMFDLFKGIGMIFIVFAHTICYFPNAYTLPFIGTYVRILATYSLMPAFFLASGYGLRKRPIAAYFRQQIPLILKPYCITAAVTTTLYFISYLIMGRHFLYQVKETVKCALGFLLALPEGGLVIWGMTYHTCGPLWYLIAMLFGSVIVMAVLNRVPEKYQWPVILLVMLAGCILKKYENISPFEIGRILWSSGIIYTGYTVKKKKLFNPPFPVWMYGIGAVSVILLTLLAPVNFSTVLKTFLMHGILGTCAGIVILYFFVLLGQRLHGQIAGALSEIGRNSFLVFCLHTVEMMALPWWEFTQLFQGKPVLGTIVTFLTRSLIIAVLFMLIRSRERWMGKWKTGKTEEIHV